MTEDNPPVVRFSNRRISEEEIQNLRKAFDEEVALLHRREPHTFTRHVAADDVREGAHEQRILVHETRRPLALVQRSRICSARVSAERAWFVMVDEVEDDVGVSDLRLREAPRSELGADVVDEALQGAARRRSVEREARHARG